MASSSVVGSRRGLRVTVRLVITAVLAATLAVGALPMLPLTTAAEAASSMSDLAVQFPDPMGSPKSASATLPAVPSGPAGQAADPTAGLVEVVERRTATTKTFLTDVPGKFLTQAFSVPVHYEDPARPGRWLPIDTSLVSLGAGLLGMSTNSFGLNLSLDARAGKLAEMRLDDDHSVSFALDGARPAVAIPGRDSITYHGVLSHTDLRLTSQAGGLKEDIVLQSSDAPDTFLFPLTLKGVTASLDPQSGSIVYRDAAGEVRGWTPAGYMVDANVDPHTAEGARSDGVAYELVPYGDGIALRIRLDRAWLNAPERVFPVTVDPSYWNSTTLEDDTVVFKNFTRDAAGDLDLHVGTYDNGTHIGISFMNFDVRGLNGKVIESAVFKVQEWHSWSCDPRGLGVYRVTQGWGGHTMTNYPGATVGERVGWTSRSIGYNASCPGGEQAFGQDGASNFMLDTVRNWTSGAWGQFGLAMKVDPGSENDNYAYKKFRSWNYCNGGTCVPHIDINWSEPNRAPYIPDNRSPGSGWVGTSAPQLCARYTDPDGNGGNVDFEIAGVVFQPVGTSQGNTACYTPNVGPGTYSWHVRAWDGQYVSDWSDWWTFTVDLPPNVPDQRGPGSGWVGTSPPTLSARYTDPDGNNNNQGNVDFDIPGVGFFPTGTTNGATATFRPNVGEGTYSWRVRGWDGYYVSAFTDYWTFTVDSSPPGTPTISSSTHPDQNAWSANNAPAFSWAASDLSGIAGYSWSFDQNQAGDPGTATAGGTTSAAYPNTGDGTWYLHVRAKNGAGLWSGIATYRVLIDATKPTPAISSSTHPSQATWYANNTPSFSWSASDTSGIVGYSWTFDQAATTDPGTSTATNTTTASYSGVPDGSSWLHVRAKNGAGVWSDPVHYKILVDKTAPGAPTTVSSSTHSAGQVSNSRTVTFSWSSASDPTPGSGVAGYRYTFNGLATLEADGSSTWTTSTSPPPYTLPADGIWYLHVKTVDGAGNLSVDKVYGPFYVDTTAPTVAKTVNRTSAGRGETVTYTITLTNTKTFPVTVTSISDTLPAGLTGVPASATVDGTVACTAATTPACVLGPQSFSVSSIAVPANSSRSIALQALALGTERACTVASNVASATNANGTTASSPVPLTICDTGLGLEPWWSYVTEPLGPQGQAAVNMANGNLVVTQTDSTPVGAHGRFAYVLRRSYNSQDSTGIGLPPGLGTPGIGAGWQLNIGQTDDLLGDGIGATGLIVPKVTTLEPVTVVYVDRDGTRHVFTPKGLAASAAVDVTSLTSGTLAALRPSVLMSGIDAAQYRICAEQTYQAPPGIHLGLWRYVRVANSGSAPCQNTAANGGVVIGFAAERPDRLRYEFAWDGRLLSMTDAAGVELRYLYDGITPGQLVPPAPADLGRLRTVYEPRSCADPSAGTCRKLQFRYSEDTNSQCPADAGDGAARCVVDPAGRMTKYHLDTASKAHLSKVDNPDGTSLVYSYGGCGGTSDQLCSASDPNGSAANPTYAVRFAYTTPANAPPGALPQLTSVTDRRGSATTFNYNGGAYATADQAGHRRRFQTIDATGRVGEIDEGNTADVYLHQSLFTWDTPGTTCRQPDNAVDNNLCRLVRKALNNGATPDEDTTWTYTAEGAKLTRRQANGSTPTDTTWGYHVQYAQADGTTACLDYTTSGNGASTPAASGACSARADGLTLFALSDLTESLTPRGNAAGATPATYRTTYVRDVPGAGGSANPNAVPSSPCTGAAGNTGLLCESRGPAFNGTGAATTTRYSYDAFGQKLTMTSPKAIAEGAATSRSDCPVSGGIRLACTAYAYYGDAELDLSGGVSAGGWLKTVTDPAGQYVAFGYDRAGNVMRTWDRNATSRAATGTTFPGTLAAPPMDNATPSKVLPYAETLYTDGTPAQAAAAPTRYVRSERDPVGNTVVYTLDKNGNRTKIRSPRGFDTTQTFDANDNLTSTLTPVEAALSGTPKWLYSYDAFDNRTVSTEPNGVVTVSIYDDANRLTATKWTRGPWPTDSSEVPAACRQSTTADAPIPAGRILCSTTKAYDGVDNVTAAADGNAQTTKFTFDAIHRQLRQDVPRIGTTFGRADTVYDLDGNPTDLCPPRQFTDGGSTTCTASGIYSEHRTYDPAGRLASSTRYRDDATPAQVLLTSHGYDADGNEISITDPNNHTTTRGFDLLGRKTSETVPRDASSGNTTLWAYDPVGNVISITRPGGVDNGTGADGDLVVDGATAANSTDDLAHPAGNPYLLPAGKNYRNVTVQNNGFISVAAYSGSSGGVLELRATGTITVCASCGITTTGKGPAGGTAGTSGTSSGTNGGGAGGGVRGTSSTGGGGGGGGGGHATAGATGPAILGSGAAGAGGPAYGRPDLTDTATLNLLGSGGGGGGGGLTGPGGAGGASGGFVHLSAATINIQGTVSAAGLAGAAGSGNGGGGGGGSGGSIWLSAPSVTLNGTSAINVSGGAAGASVWGTLGGAGAAGLVRIDSDTLTGVTPPSGWVQRKVGRVSAYRYDADNRQIEVVQGASDSDATKAGMVDADGGINIRSRIAYDADGNIVARFEPRAFTASTTTPDARFMVRTDYDADGRPVAQWTPRYDNGAASDAGPNATQAADCPVPTSTHKPQAATSQPDFAAGLPDYPAGVGVCLTRAEYDATGNVVKVILPTAGWNTSTSSPVDANRYVAYGYTDDHLVATVDAPSPKTDNARVTASRAVYDGVGQQVKTVDALGHAQTMAYTADRLLTRSEAQRWTPAGGTEISHVTTYGYDANGNKTSETDALNQTATWAYWSDNLVKNAVDAGSNKTSYGYDLAGNPTTVTSPSANARDATNPSGTPAANTYTADNLLLTATTPVAGDGSSRRQVAYSYDGGGRKIAQQTLTVTGSGAVMASSGTQRFAYHPNDRLRQEIGRDGATITTRYDAAGNRIEVTDSSGSTLTGTYYLDGLPRSVSDGARPAFYSYDGAGQLTYRADATSTAGNASRYVTTYVANDAGLPASANSSLTGSGNWTWTWDGAGRPDKETDPNGQTVTRNWNPDDTLARQFSCMSGSATTSTGCSTGAQTIADWTYTYDGLFRQKTQGWSGTSPVGGNAVPGTFTYGYDPAGRLTSFNDGTATKALTWDHDGNRLSFGAQTFAYNADDSIASTDADGPGPASVKSYAYATFGGVSSDGDCSYGYDGFDRLVIVSNTTSSCATTTPITYLYDGLDRQRSRTVASATIGFHYDGWADPVTVEMPSGSSDAAYVLDQGDQQKAVATQGILGTTEYLTDDGQGNITTATSTAAVTGCTARFDPFGAAINPLSASNPCSSGSTNDSAFYRSGRMDKTTGDYQLGSRTYDPKKGTFLTPDTYRAGDPAQNLAIGVDPLTRNTYAYVNGDPVNLIDPDGHISVHCPTWLCGNPKWGRHQKTIDGVKLWVRGWLSDLCVHAFACEHNEQIAQALAVQYASKTLGRRGVADDVDWEASQFKSRTKGSWFVDILVHNSTGDWAISEVKEYKGPSTDDAVERQLRRYETELNAFVNGNATITRDDRFLGWTARFKGVPNIFGAQTTYVEWSPEPGKIYFAPEEKVRNWAKKSQFFKDIYAKSRRSRLYNNRGGGLKGFFRNANEPARPKPAPVVP